jgi:hypothetical protein
MIHGFVVMARLGALDNIYRRTYAVKMGGSINRAGPVTGVPEWQMNSKGAENQE